MDLTQLANLGEFIGGVAVLVTLIYLAVQVRQNTSQLRQQTASTVVTNLQAAFDPIFPNFEVYAQGLSGERELSKEDALMFATLMIRILHGMQNSYYQNREGVLAGEWEEFYGNVLRFFLATPGGTKWWSDYRTFFSEGFGAAVDALLREERP